VGQRLRPVVSTEPQEDLLALKGLVERDEVTPVVGRTYPLIEAPDAIRYLEEGHAAGKIVITV
jgi:NADPH:quinone reductase-like Zn-dependent oxidoreductase